MPSCYYYYYYYYYYFFTIIIIFFTIIIIIIISCRFPGEPVLAKSPWVFFLQLLRERPFEGKWRGFYGLDAFCCHPANNVKAPKGTLFYFAACKLKTSLCDSAYREPRVNKQDESPTREKRA